MSVVVVIIVLVLRGMDPSRAAYVAVCCASVAAELAVLLGTACPMLRRPADAPQVSR